MAASGESATPESQVRAWIAAGERYDVEFKGELRAQRRQADSSGVSLLRANLSGAGSDEAASTKSQLTVTGNQRERNSTLSR